MMTHYLCKNNYDIMPDEVYNLADQSHVAVSLINQNPTANSMH